MALELKNVSFQVAGETHIYDTDLSLEAGGFNILLGTTRSGKTTLMRLMAGLERPSNGRVFFAGKDVTGLAVQRRNVAMVYQQFINYPNMNVFDNIASPLRVAKLAKAEIDSRVNDIAELLRLTPLLQRQPLELSGGQQQRTALARALVKDSDLVLLDEPLANLDYKLREELRDELPRLMADKGATVVYATSEPGEALLLGGHTATLQQGRVTQFGPTLATYAEPVNLATAQVFADPPLNTAKVHKRGGWFHLSDIASWPANTASAAIADGEYIVGARAYHLSLTPPQDGAIELQAKVLLAELSGSESLIHLTFGEHTWVLQAHGVHAVGLGSEISMYLRSDHFMYFSTAGDLVAAA